MTAATTVSAAFQFALAAAGSVLLGTVLRSAYLAFRASSRERWRRGVELAWTLVPLTILAALATLLYPSLHG